jgi:Ca2+-binding RTX toxin-like protein
MLFGEGGNDSLYGDDGRDVLGGGLGADRLGGGAGPDTFFYRDPMHESPATSQGADTILDFSLSEGDRIDLPVFGTPDSYHSAATNATSMDEAAQEANQNHGGNALDRYLYLANEKTDTGYLLADLDGNGNFETGITLVGNGGPGEFGYNAIV